MTLGRWSAETPSVIRKATEILEVFQGLIRGFD
jgi:hypothetical protein